MSLAATSIAYEASRRDPVAKLVLIALADYADEAGRTRVSFDALAEFTGLSEIEIEAVLIKLESEGFVRLVESPDAYQIQGIAA